ncbi:bifunctional riboflavin kinase/FAD synthetase [Riemerella anatipestifer]|uniref:Riboflavin biosynthesis protein n=1 Tax=Riemerella anatipestifer (strain ATCC 11845 / DSM 15868 / JCM 9532 / NCTC 11014) TaxID=693978 RepID=E4TDK0_RIEAD|nr:bifunctional riboflavin kinase/FAD synthetase [Riemerella anatipestifer]ADQ82859.1 riboflavin biosynthesis protein RibF [Riemerella anatipestifer ATCC 11845 = DSM 15868]ADZ11646.1 FAD synthase [Riemerella anatipestifer RA-GD]AFD56871.1 riboflavin biosynthesis protein ribf [Riemerella anatipestifer ATCC 11845 = DSM 15868]AGC41185.1 FAD synthase [Riemerella anatipestifer RA-CH-2]AKQ40458.1 riboflavin biosynthesis protein RibF [Riemerella anatipestifer Yb2]
MKVISSISEYKNTSPTALSIGMFDGVHLGHQSIIKNLKKISDEKKLSSGLLTFWPHPRTIFNPNENLKLLNTLAEKTSLIENLGVDFLFLQNFDEDFRNLSADDFVKKILVDKLNVKHLIIGYDHRFGKDKKGDFNLLQKMATEFDFEVQQLDAIQLENQNISSTKIRNAITSGDFKSANDMLGYHYPLSGKVIHGKKIGRTIGYPTANISIDNIKLLPKKGAYIVEVWIDNLFYKGMLSVGTNPTVSGTELSIEVYILDFNKDIYDQDITIKFRDFLHEEIKFDGLEALIKKLDEDKALTESFEF